MENNFVMDNAIGVFDSGVGGISVLREIYKIMPNRQLIYFGDQIHVPYGPRPLEQVKGFSETISRFLITSGASVIVVACNAASAAALHHLRNQFPTIPFVGMEPAVKPAAEYTNTGKVGVLATPATFQGRLYASVVERFAMGVELIQDTCPGLVQEIEKGDLKSIRIKKILEKALTPMIHKGIDTVVLGCTHYPFVIPVIKEIVGDNVKVIDPAPAISRQTKKVYDSMNINYSQQLQKTPYIITSGNLSTLKKNFVNFFQVNVKFFQANWSQGNCNLNLTHEK